MQKISPDVQNHLKRVYFTLACTLLVSALGVYSHLLWNIGGLLTATGLMASVVWLLSTPPNPYNEGKRVKLLMAAALCEGASLGPLVGLVVNIDPGIVGTALVGTSLTFACFSAAAIFAQRREFMFLGGILGSGLSILLWLNISSALFGESTATFEFEIYFGLLLFIGYIIFDTQAIIERADHGDYDYIEHSLQLFIDFVAVLARLLIIMAKNSARKSEKEEEKRKSEKEKKKRRD
ncbi:bax inhibitor 1 [Cryptomeria japonica]|uniref:bax inhibitor 1 n=1 Tax=Cryptomeria japonica TaxID=3369 RepID=UPI0027D9EAE8|nr:bax inhibitor 1 [Cryptomeria japonica]